MGHTAKEYEGVLASGGELWLDCAIPNHLNAVTPPSTEAAFDFQVAVEKGAKLGGAATNTNPVSRWDGMRGKFGRRDQ